ncbi:hypothetical protein BDN67DRAFT_976231, partial [Paxillus ammoniavirescens]
MSQRSHCSPISPNDTASSFWSSLTIISATLDEDTAHRLARISVLADSRCLTVQYSDYYKLV